MIFYCMITALLFLCSIWVVTFVQLHVQYCSNSWSSIVQPCRVSRNMICAVIQISLSSSPWSTCQKRKEKLYNHAFFLIDFRKHSFILQIILAYPLRRLSVFFFSRDRCWWQLVKWVFLLDLRYNLLLIAADITN